jgi:hypothetical protein
MPSPTWNHGAVRRHFQRLVEGGRHTALHADYRAGEGAAQVVHAYLLRGPFGADRMPDLSKRARASLRAGTWAFVTHEEWVDGWAVTYFAGAPEADEAEARGYYDGFARLMGRRLG